MANKNVFKLWDVVTITEADEDNVNGVIMDVFDGGEYRTDARGVLHNDVLQIAPTEECEAAYEGMAETFNNFYEQYKDKKKLKSFFDKVTEMFPDNEKVRPAHEAKPESKPESTECGFFFD